MEKYIKGIRIKEKNYRIVDIKNYMNGKGYEILSEEEFLSPDRDFRDENKMHIYVLNYSPLNSFLSNNLGADDKTKINKPLTIYYVNNKKIVVKSNDEYFFMEDEIYPDNKLLAGRFGFNKLYVRELLDLSKEEFIDSIKDNKSLKLTK